jgi:hypothetical protein
MVLPAKQRNAKLGITIGSGIAGIVFSKKVTSSPIASACMIKAAVSIIFL